MCKKDEEERDLSTKTRARLDGYNAVIEIILLAKRVVEQERGIKNIKLSRSFKDELAVLCENLVLSEGEDKAFSEIKKKVESWLDYSIAQKTVDNEKKVKIYRLGELAIKDENNNRDEEDGNKK
jgi:hypothetical protein